MVTGLNFVTSQPTRTLDPVTQASVGTANFQTRHLVDGKPCVEALTSDLAGEAYIDEFGGEAADDALAEIKSSDMSPEEKEAAIANLAEDVKAGHLAKAALSPDPAVREDFKEFLGPKGAEIYDRSIANRLPANSKVPVPPALTNPNTAPETRVKAFNDYVDNLVKAGELTPEQAKGLKTMYEFDVATFHGGDHAEAAQSIGKELQAKQVPDGAPPKLSEDGKTLTARSGHSLITATTLEDGTKQVTIENIVTGEKTVVTPPLEGPLAFELEGGGELRLETDAAGDITGMKLNADGDLGDDYSTTWGADGFTEPSSTDWLALPPQANLTTLTEVRGQQGKQEDGWKTTPAAEKKPEPTTTEPKTPAPTVTKIQGTDNAYLVDVDGDGKNDFVGFDSDKNDKPDQYFPLPTPAAA
jgi:hypothetical protein